MTHDHQPTADPTGPAPTAQVTALVIPASGPPRAETITPDLPTLQRLVGGMIGAVRRDGWLAYLNDEGKLLGLPVNQLATEILFPDSGHPDFVAGDVVLLGDHPDGENAPVPMDLLHRVLAHGTAADDMTPAHLIAAIRHVYDDVPAEPLILIGLGDGRILTTITSTLQELDEGRLNTMIGTLAPPDVTAAVVAIVSDRPHEQLPLHPHLSGQLRWRLASRQVDVVQMLRMPDLEPGTPWIDCDTGATGTLPDLGSDPAAVRRLILRGAISLPSDRTLAARLITDAATADQDAARVIRLSSSRPVDQPTAGGQDPIAALTTAVEALAADRFDTGQHDLARMVLSLHRGPVRNAALRLTCDHTHAAGQLWTLLVRYTTRAAHHRDHPATLLALAAYLQGDARRARMALAVVSLTTRPNMLIVPEVLEAARRGWPPALVRHTLTAALDTARTEPPAGPVQTGNDPASTG